MSEDKDMADRALAALRSAHPGEPARVREYYESEIARLRQELRVAHDERADDVWFWQGDGTDDLGSLSCPVVIEPDVLASLLRPAHPLAATPAVAHEGVEGETRDTDAESLINALQRAVHRTYAPELYTDAYGEVRAARAALLAALREPREQTQSEVGAGCSTLWDVRKIAGVISAVDMPRTGHDGWVTVRVPRERCGGLVIGATAQLSVLLPPRETPLSPTEQPSVEPAPIRPREDVEQGERAYREGYRDASWATGAHVSEPTLMEAWNASNALAALRSHASVEQGGRTYQGWVTAEEVSPGGAFRRLRFYTAAEKAWPTDVPAEIHVFDGASVEVPQDAPAVNEPAPLTIRDNEFNRFREKYIKLAMEERQVIVRNDAGGIALVLGTTRRNLFPEPDGAVPQDARRGYCTKCGETQRARFEGCALSECDWFEGAEAPPGAVPQDEEREQAAARILSAVEQAHSAGVWAARLLRGEQPREDRDGD